MVVSRAIRSSLRLRETAILALLAGVPAFATCACFSPGLELVSESKSVGPQGAVEICPGSLARSLSAAAALVGFTPLGATIPSAGNAPDLCAATLPRPRMPNPRTPASSTRLAKARPARHDGHRAERMRRCPDGAGGTMVRGGMVRGI